MNIKEKYILTCSIEELKGFTPNNTNEYVYYKGLGKGKILVVDVKTKEIEFSSKDLLKLIEGKYKVVEYMSKGLEALECSLKLYKMVESAGNGNGFSLNEAWEYHETIKQALLKAQEQEKILSIILKKRIDLESFYSTFVKDDLDYKYYEKYYGTYGLEKLTQEEFILLKEVLEEL